MRLDENHIAILCQHNELLGLSHHEIMGMLGKCTQEYEAYNPKIGKKTTASYYHDILNIDEHAITFARKGFDENSKYIFKWSNLAINAYLPTVIRTLPLDTYATV
jgi:hypothetical protein